MPLSKAFIPYGAYYSTPFCKWQGSLANEHALELAARVGKKALAARAIDPTRLDALALGMTVPQLGTFYGAPWLAGLLGAPTITGPMISQACATSMRVLATAAAEVELGMRRAVLAIAADRTSNGPHMVFPSARGPGGKPDATDWVWDSFGRDPWAKNAMLETAEKVAREAGFTREQQDEVALLRFTQYERALADGRAFQKRYMAPVELEEGKGKVRVVDADEGVFPVTAEGLKKLRPVTEGGTLTFGTQTHPADGNAAMVVTDEATSAELSRDKKLPIRIVSFGDARVDKGMMPKAVVPAAQAALAAASLTAKDCKAINTHNPFAVNDLYLCKTLELPLDRINRFGSPLVYGHPQAPTGLRALIELIEELAMLGGGHGLFTGCAAGDTAMAVVVKVG